MFYDNCENDSITGHIPVLYNSECAELVVEFTDEVPTGTVVGVHRVYVANLTYLFTDIYNQQY